MRSFITEDFLLSTGPARRLYHDYAEKMPIFDYHCHLDPQEIYEDKRFSDIGEAWLAGDHYKWRLMRANAVPEQYVTGSASFREKFDPVCRDHAPADRQPPFTTGHIWN